MSDPVCSAAREALRCETCGVLILAVTLEAPLDAQRCLLMLSAILRASHVLDLLECDTCIVKRVGSEVR